MVNKIGAFNEIIELQERVRERSPPFPTALYFYPVRKIRDFLRIGMIIKTVDPRSPYLTEIPRRRAHDKVRRER